MERPMKTTDNARQYDIQIVNILILQ